MKAVELYRQAAALGLQLQPRGDKLGVTPADRVPPEFVLLLKEHKGELLTFLEGRAHRLSPDQVPWLHVARQVNAGEFIGSDANRIEALVIGLRGLAAHPSCREALRRLADEPKCPRAIRKKILKP